MILRVRRQTLVVFRQSAGSADSYVTPKLAEPASVRRRMHVGVLIAAIGLKYLVRGARARWRLIVVAAALTTASIARYRTSAQRRDLAATLDRYPDGVTCELRDILTIL